MATQTIFTEHLNDILHAAMDWQQTGLLSVEHTGEQDEEKAEIYLENGKIVLARTRSEVGDAALASVYRWKQAYCTFFEGIISPVKREIVPRQDVAPALAALARRRVETDSAPVAAAKARRSTGPLPGASSSLPLYAPLPRVELMHPGVDATFRSLPAAATPHVMNRMERRERIVFMLLDGRRSVREVARLTHQTEVNVAHILVHLLKNGYIEYIQG